MDYRSRHAADVPGSTDEIVFAAPEGVVGLLGCCTVVVHTQTATSAIVTAMGYAYAKAAARFEKIAHLCLIEPGSGLLPMGDARSSLGALMKRYDSRFAVGTIVYEEAGFRATAVRSIVTGLCLASRTTHPTRVFSELVPACQWTATLLAPHDQVAPEQLLAAVRELRRSHHQHTLRDPSP